MPHGERAIRDTPAFVQALLPFEMPDDPALCAFLSSLEDKFCEDGTSRAARAVREAEESAESQTRQRLLAARTVMVEIKQLMAEQYLAEAPPRRLEAPGRLLRAFELFENCSFPSTALSELMHFCAQCCLLTSSA